MTPEEYQLKIADLVEYERELYSISKINAHVMVDVTADEVTLDGDFNIEELQEILKFMNLIRFKRNEFFGENSGEGYETVVHPPHYNQVPGIECKDVIGWFPTHVGSAIKYLWRCGFKPHTSEIEDLRKAVEFIKFEIERRSNP